MALYRVFNLVARFADGEELRLGTRHIPVEPEDVADACHGGPDTADVIAANVCEMVDEAKSATYDYREVRPERLVGVEAMTVYERSREYGGPEEGGWWYDLDRPVRTFYVEKRRAFRLRQKLELWCAGKNEGRRRYDEERYVVLSGPARKPRRPHYC